jgi:hypothetical protein
MGENNFSYVQRNIDVEFHYVILLSEIYDNIVIHRGISLHMADIMTKNLDTKQFIFLRNQLLGV